MTNVEKVFKNQFKKPCKSSPKSCSKLTTKIHVVYFTHFYNTYSQFLTFLSTIKSPLSNSCLFHFSTKSTTTTNK